jgi:hypothetical protein
VLAFFLENKTPGADPRVEISNCSIFDQNLIFIPNPTAIEFSGAK